MREFHTNEKVSDCLYLIHEKYCDESGLLLGLVIGRDKAALIDSGLGAVDGLRDYVEKLTEKPVICLLTHGHPDHAGGAALFDTVYMSEADQDEIQWGLTRKRRLSDLHDFCNNDPEVLSYAQNHCVDCSHFTWQPVRDGDIFDLGGVQLEAMAMPGHTKGSMAFVNRADRYIFTGDAVAATLMLTSYLPSAMEDNYHALKRLVETVESMENCQIYGAHYEHAIPVQPAKDLRDACKEILEGKVGADERTHFKYAEMNDPDIILYKHIKNDVAVTYNRAIVQQITE